MTTANRIDNSTLASIDRRPPIQTGTLRPVALEMMEMANRMLSVDLGAHRSGLAEIPRTDEAELGGRAYRLLLALEDAGLVDETGYAQRLAALCDDANPYEPELLADGMPVCTDDPDQGYGDSVERFRQLQVERARRELPGDVDLMSLAQALNKAAAQRQLH